MPKLRFRWQYQGNPGDSLASFTDVESDVIPRTGEFIWYGDTHSEIVLVEYEIENINESTAAVVRINVVVRPAKFASSAKIGQ
jgi:hypothetical protein